MAVPEAVRKAAEQADAIIKQQGNTDKAPEEAPQKQPEKQETPAEQPTSEDMKADEQPKEATKGEAHWEQRYQVLQGKYNAEVPKLREEVKTLQSQLAERGDSSQLKLEVERLKSENSQLTERLNQQPAQPSADLNKLREEYGDELADSIESLIQGRLQGVEGKLNELSGTVKKVSETASHSEKVGSLTKLLASKGIDFAQRNNDPLFIDWLNEPDALSGQTRNQLLQSAFNGGEIERAANIFTAYDGGTTKTSEPVKPDLSQHTQTPSNTGADTVANDEVWTQDKIAAFYNNVRAGKYSREEADKLEKSIFRQLNSG